MDTFDDNRPCPGPDGEIMSIREMFNRASSCFERFHSTDCLSHLNEGIPYGGLVVSALRAASHPSRAHVQNEFGVVYRHRFLKTFSRADLDLAFQHQMQAIEALPPGDHNLPRLYADLAYTYQVKFNGFNDLDALEQALKFTRRAIELTPPRDPDLLWRMSKLPILYNNRFKRLGNKEDFDAALKTALPFILIVPPNDPRLHTYQHILGDIYNTSFLTFDNIDSLRSSILWTKLAVENIRSDDAELAQYQADLSTTYTHSFSRLGNLDDLHSAMKYATAALDATPPGHRKLASRQHTLAGVHTQFFRRFSKLEHLENAIQLEKSALDITSPDDPERHSYHYYLAISYGERFERLHNPSDFELAIKHNTAAVESCPPDHTLLPRYQQSLSKSYLSRFYILGDPSTIEKALEYSQLALSNTPPYHAELQMWRYSLSKCYDARYLALNRLEDLKTAIELQESVIEKMPPDDPTLAYVYSTLAESYQRYFRAVHDLDHLKASITYKTKAIEKIPQDHAQFAYDTGSLGFILRSYYFETKDKEFCERALLNFRCSAMSSTSPWCIWSCAIAWGEIDFTQSNVSNCIEAFSVAFKAIPSLAWVGSSISVRHKWLKDLEIPRHAALAASAAVKFDKPELAVEFLEQSLTITHRQTLQLRDGTSVELVDKHPELANRLQEISSNLHQMEASNPVGLQVQSKSSDLDSYHLLAIERNNLIEEIHKLDGFESFLSPPTFTYLSRAADNGPVIMINTHDEGSQAIVVLAQPHHHVKIVPLPQVNDHSVQGILGKLRLALEIIRIKSRSSESGSDQDRAGRKFQQDKQTAQKLFQEVINALWTTVVEPVFQMLKENGIGSGRIWWCPTGIFTYLPLHAAGATGPYIQSYTFTLEALIQARKKAGPPITSVTALGVPNLPGRPELSLPSVTKELAKIESIATQHKVAFTNLAEESNPTLALAMQSAPWLHLACHGEQDLKNPLDSRLLLRDGPLQLKQILAANSSFSQDAQFVFLSACQTAMGDGELVNEAMHMAGAFMTAGFRGAVGTLWSMADVDGPVVAEVFYEKVFGLGTTDEVTTLGSQEKRPVVELAAEALKAAVDKLREQDAPFERWMPFVHFGV